MLAQVNAEWETQMDKKRVPSCAQEGLFPLEKEKQASDLEGDSPTPELS